MAQRNLWMSTSIQLFHILIDIHSHHISQLNQIFTQYPSLTGPSPVILVHSITITTTYLVMAIHTINLKYRRMLILDRQVLLTDHFRDFMEIPINWVDRTVILIQCRDEVRLSLFIKYRCWLHNVQKDAGNCNKNVFDQLKPNISFVDSKM